MYLSGQGLNTGQIMVYSCNETWYRSHHNSTDMLSESHYIAMNNKMTFIGY